MAMVCMTSAIDLRTNCEASNPKVTRTSSVSPRWICSTRR